MEQEIQQAIRNSNDDAMQNALFNTHHLICADYYEIITRINHLAMLQAELDY